MTEFPKYLSGTTDSMYWHSRLIAALTDAQFGNAQILKNASEHMKIRYHRGDN